MSCQGWDIGIIFSFFPPGSHSGVSSTRSQFRLCWSDDDVLEVAVLTIGSPGSDRVKNSVALLEAVETDNDIKGPVKALRRLPRFSRYARPSTHIERDDMSVRNIASGDVVSTYVAQSYSNLAHGRVAGALWLLPKVLWLPHAENLDDEQPTNPAGNSRALR